MNFVSQPLNFVNSVVNQLCTVVVVLFPKLYAVLSYEASLFIAITLFLEMHHRVIDIRKRNGRIRI